MNSLEYQNTIFNTFVMEGLTSRFWEPWPIKFLWRLGKLPRQVVGHISFHCSEVAFEVKIERLRKSSLVFYLSSSLSSTFF